VKNKPFFRFSPPTTYPLYSPPFQSGNTPPRSAVEELQMASPVVSHYSGESPPHQPKQEIKQSNILQQKTQRQQSNTVKNFPDFLNFSRFFEIFKIFKIF